MQAIIELSLKTREVFKLFERHIDGDRLFIEAILHKFNIVMRQCKQQAPRALVAYDQINQAILTLTQQFSDEVNRFETILEKRKEFGRKQINFITQFHTVITINTPLSMRLIEFIEVYDRLIAILKLLHLTGCFASDNDYYANIKRIQTLANQILSSIILTPMINIPSHQCATKSRSH